MLYRVYTWNDIPGKEHRAKTAADIDRCDDQFEIDAPEDSVYSIALWTLNQKKYQIAMENLEEDTPNAIEERAKEYIRQDCEWAEGKGNHFIYAILDVARNHYIFGNVWSNAAIRYSLAGGVTREDYNSWKTAQIKEKIERQEESPITFDQAILAIISLKMEKYAIETLWKRYTERVFEAD